MSKIQRTLVFSVKGNDYQIDTPTQGKLIDIEVMKSIISKNQYGNILSNKTTQANDRLDTIDMFAFLTVMCPKLMKDIKAVTWEDMDIFDVAELKVEYKKQIEPWIAQLEEGLRNITQDSEVDKSNS